MAIKCLQPKIQVHLHGKALEFRASRMFTTQWWLSSMMEHTCLLSTCSIISGSKLPHLELKMMLLLGIRELAKGYALLETEVWSKLCLIYNSKLNLEARLGPEKATSHLPFIFSMVSYHPQTCSVAVEMALSSTLLPIVLKIIHLVNNSSKAHFSAVNSASASGNQIISDHSNNHKLTASNYII